MLEFSQFVLGVVAGVSSLMFILIQIRVSSKQDKNL